MGRLFVYLQYLLPHHLLSRLVGRLAASEQPWVRKTFIGLFSRAFAIDMSESLHQAHEFASFNDFFTRELKPGSRPVTANHDQLCSPADGTVSECGQLEGNLILQAKGHTYSLEKLLAATHTPYQGGSFATIYLAPSNYHRVHMPFSGRLTAVRYVPGRLFSVNDVTATHVPDLFAINERMVCEFDTEQGPAAVVMVGAMIVAGVRPRWREHPYPSHYREELPENVEFEKGDELGQFLLGSTAIVITQFPVDWTVKKGDKVKVNSAITR